ncbi:MAG: hypothetical protein QOF48_2880 [Verrucomicrobiota bacterium]|jgi:cellulose synthase/poly-beta-1,6-N-acetylglucosamine synthase-like glycosyltransferase
MILVVCIAFSLYLACQLRFALLPVIERLRRGIPEPSRLDLAAWPRVTVQLAVYRESRVLRRLLEAVLAMEAPAGTVVIQVLDDSVGEDAEKTRDVVAQFASGPTPIHYLNRGSREGFKAGALNHGLEVVKTDFVVFFDADCLPKSEFLRQTLPYLVEPDVAAVQARWDFPNAHVSPLTQLQAAIFEWLFRYEMALRVELGLPAFYMGSAAVWRTAAIRKLGGWQETPFTAEDLDLVYRAGIENWRVLYHPGVVASTTAVEDILAFRTQQRRWARSMLRVGWDRFPGVLRRRCGWPAKLFDVTVAIAHSSAPVLMALAVASAGAVLAGVKRPPAWIAIQLLFSATVIVSPIGITLLLAQRSFHRDWPARGWRLVRALPQAMGLGISFAFGLLDFIRASGAEFTATPKGGEVGVVQGSKRKWLYKHLGPVICEGVIGGFVALAAIRAASSHPEATLPLAVVGACVLLSCVQTSRAMFRHVAQLRRGTARVRQQG